MNPVNCQCLFHIFSIDIMNIYTMEVDIKIIPMLSYIVLKMEVCDFKSYNYHVHFELTFLNLC